MDIQKYIKDEGFNPFPSDENVIDYKERELVKGKNIFSESKNKNKPSGVHQFLLCNWIDPDFYWGWKARMENGKARGVITLLTVKDFHSVELWPRVKMGCPARSAVSIATAEINCLFATRKYCPMIDSFSTYDKEILVGQTLETENIFFENDEGIITEKGVQRVVETGEQVGTYVARYKDLKNEV
jgi:hypothetical protein|tara:strand:- start:91 stop:645 length:555 start_codon:yes stop_codon:yes gene_type:complete